MVRGKLFLIPSMLADDAVGRSIVPQTMEVMNSINEYIVENEKSARKFLKCIGICQPQNTLIIHEYGKHSKKEELGKMIKGLYEGRNIGLLSEAGCPAVADPGADVVQLAHDNGIMVVPLVGPSSILLAQMASGFNGQSFAFHGYLPIDKQERIRRIKDLEKISEKLNQTQIFIETPYRNNQLVEDILKSCQSATRFCIAAELTSSNEWIKTMHIAEWKKISAPDLHKKPTVFLLYKGR